MGPETPERWGTFLMASALVHNPTSAIPLSDLSASGLPAVVDEYSQIIRNHASVLGLINVTMQSFVDIVEREMANETESKAALNNEYFSTILNMAYFFSLRIIKTLVQCDDPQSLEWLATSCRMPEFTEIALHHTVSSRDVRSLMHSCYLSQGVLLEAITRQGNHGPSWREKSLVHEVAVIGSEELLKYVLAVEPVGIKTGTLPTHIAAKWGWPKMIAPMIEHGYDAEAVDPKTGYSALDIACLQRWRRAEIDQAFGLDAYPKCVRKGLLAPYNKGKTQKFVEAGGGWLADAYITQPKEMCDFDVRVDLTAEEFVFNYANPRRPVVIRGGLKGKAWEALQERWSKDKIVKMHPDVIFNMSIIPYGHQFNILDGNKDVDIKTYTDYMATVSDKNAGMLVQPDLMADDETPDNGTGYVFSSLSVSERQDSSLHKTILPLEPDFVDWERMENFSPQFYLGAAGTGAPMHFHVHAYNVLVHGRKRWMVMPPRHGVYSKQHITSWLHGDYKQHKADNEVLECIQEPGDVIYIPMDWSHGVLNLAESVG